MNRIAKKLALICSIVAICGLIVCGAPKPQQPTEKILVRIDGKIDISLDEFIRRAEYTPRPPYARLNTYLHKKIILNSLIAEKLLALEAGDDNPMLQDEEFQRFLIGRKEQAMRQWMHHVEATEKVALDSADIKKAYKLAGREYEIEYFTSSDSSFANRYTAHVSEPDLFYDAFFELTGDRLPPERTVKWLDKEHPAVHAALFEREFQIGQVLEPIRVEDDYLFIKIKGWHDDVAFTPGQQLERLNNVKEKLTSLRASEIWNARVAEIMRGKKLDLQPDVFRKLGDLFFAIYFHSDQERRNQLIEKVWDVEFEESKAALENISDEDFLQQPFFTVDGATWTVADFRDAIGRHPLVFRERRMSSLDFPAQFRLAIADLVRDHYVTQEAYEKGYDQVNVVGRNVNMWKDSYLAIYQRQKYLSSVGENRHFLNNYQAIIDETLNPYIRELQQKYYKQIELDFEAFENISLTTIDLFVKQPEMPFKYVVPMFPLVTTEHMIDYVTRMPDDRIH
ncbi:hypothetical protein JW998_11495 [candidate division KSB1 bacterium]|nr:hypothetical protein [candidate division KSB1 bacterium]